MNRPLPGVYLRAGRVGGESSRSPERGPFPTLPAAARRGRPKLPRTSPRDVGDACVTVVAAEAGSRPPTPRSPRTPVPCTRDRTCGARYCSGASVPALAPAAGPGSLRIRRSGGCGTCRPATGIGRPNGKAPVRIATKGGLTCTYLVELRGFEPLTFSLRTRRATNCATAPVRRRATRWETLAPDPRALPIGPGRVRNRRRGGPSPRRGGCARPGPRRARRGRSPRPRPCDRRSRLRCRRGRSCAPCGAWPPAW